MTRILRTMLHDFRRLVQIWAQVVCAKNTFGISLHDRLRALFMGGFTPDQYVLFDLKRNDPKNYLSQLEVIRTRAINSPFKQIINNPIVCKEVLGHYLDVQRVYARIAGDGKFISNGSEVRQPSDLDKLLNERGMIVFRKTRGVKQRIIRKTGDIIAFENGPSFSTWSWLKWLHGWYILEPIPSHGYAENFGTDQLVTIKIITFRDVANDRWKVCYALHRIPFGDATLISRIDLASGELSSALDAETKKVYASHPVTAALIEGTYVPHWQDVKENLMRASEQFPFLCYLVYTIVITESSFMVVNAKTSTELTTAQLWEGQRQQELGKFFEARGLLKPKK